ncbi:MULTISPECIES: helix-turn-helix transcriptional regulator [Nocardiaceae]|uniref:helix-turn-helix transcriptional regulator n=1 Tax=Nocardiaceae TaxID=85025 RepID=UPI0005660C83|nr:MULTISPECIES: YafY family protein [Rhodococcus]OZE94409.1 YafY family transcriptional regulator [Rhodococcus sp. 15-1189-1-1a]OZF09491.1 YafY family transcriptional regulator [Rhodococcus sp. 14-2686-1-2]OZF43897.1 YafY family transcriptional regulator [Rhodococcus sp. 14-2470-1b]
MSARLSVRLARLLNMVPFFLANPGLSAAEAARELGVSTSTLMTDLNQLWMCGLPGYGPGDLIDLSFSEESIEVTFSAGIDRPLRLTSTEATALLVALRSLTSMPGMVDPSAAQSAIAKIEQAAGSASANVPGNASAEPADDRPESPIATAVRSALRSKHALELTYYSASRDAVSERVVDPIRTVSIDDHSYLQAWCRSAEGVRLFRLDRIDRAVELEVPASPPEGANEDDSFEIFNDDPSLPQARLRVLPSHAWILDYYPMTVVDTEADGSIVVTMRFATPAWMTRLTLGFGEGVQVLGPPELQRSVEDRAAEALAAYDDVVSGKSGVNAP